MKKVLTTEEISKVVKKIKHQGETIVLAGGCFDILHAGHIQFLTQAKNAGDVLLIILESDETIRRLKGNNRPIHSQKTRAKVLSQLSIVNHVIVIPPLRHDSEYSELVKKLKPDIIALTKGDPIKVKKMEHAKAINAQILEVIERIEPYSTTKIAKNILLSVRE